MSEQDPTTPDDSRLEAPQSLKDDLGQLFAADASIPPEIDRAVLAGATRHFTRARRLRMVLRFSPVLAAAACVMLLVTTWSASSIERDVGRFLDYEDPRDRTAVRGDSPEALAELEAPPHWIASALAEPGVADALAEMDMNEPRLLSAMTHEWIILTAGRWSLAAGLTEEQALPLRRIIERDHEAVELVVDALVRHLPGADEHDREAIRQALAKRRAKDVFGITK